MPVDYPLLFDAIYLAQRSCKDDIILTRLLERCQHKITLLEGDLAFHKEEEARAKALLFQLFRTIENFPYCEVEDPQNGEDMTEFLIRVRSKMSSYGWEWEAKQCDSQ